MFSLSLPLSVVNAFCEHLISKHYLNYLAYIRVDNKSLYPYFSLVFA